MALANLPVEIILKIMCACHDTVSLLRLSATCRRLRQIWCDNTAHITTAILSISSEDLQDALNFATLEASLLEESDPEPTSEAGPGATVRRHLKSVGHSVQCAKIIRSIYKSKNAEQIERFPYRRDEGWSSLNLHIDAVPNFLNAFLAIRRLALGYDHEQILTAAYDSIHELSDAGLDSLYTVSEILHRDCMDHWNQMGILGHEGEEAWWQDGPSENYYGPLCWEYANRTIHIEVFWRFGSENAESKQRGFKHHHEQFGQKKVALMYATYKHPWTKESWECVGQYRGNQLPLS